MMRLGIGWSVAFFLVLLLQIPDSAWSQERVVRPAEVGAIADTTWQKVRRVPPSILVLDYDQIASRLDFFDNQDWDWYRENIPLLDCPDDEITKTYYYRWDLMTKHLVYGSPKDGYAFTEFIDRPFWSGTYGAISCPAGHQLYEARWLRHPTIAEDYARYWFRTPGAEPRNYSCWIADAIWALHSVHPNEPLLLDLLPDLKANYQGWVDRHWVEEQGMFWQTGHDDGMELNINSRQTADAVRGAPGFRPTLNSYLWADALAIARIAELAGDESTSQLMNERADLIKAKLQQSLWDANREFFLQRYQHGEQHEGHRIEAGSLTYQSGKFAGSRHGRELIGYVPWQFELPDPGYESAWKYLMDPEYFYAPFGPTSVERHDPMFYLANHCCFWSGQSWPYATTQTLKGMANLLQRYQQSYVDRDDYVRLLGIYARSHRKNGQPYLAEACNPDTGSWEFHDAYNHSEHYFHSGFVDLVLSGLVGIRNQDGPALRLRPLIPESWDFLAVDNLLYKEHQVSIVWDRSGQRYGKGEGFQVWIDGVRAYHSKEPRDCVIDLPETLPEPRWEDRLVNVAVNNSLSPFPIARASSTDERSSLNQLIDGNYWYLVNPPNRWLSQASQTNSEEWVEVDFGVDRQVQRIGVYLLDDGKNSEVSAPTSLNVELWKDGKWESVGRWKGEAILRHRPTWFDFPISTISKVRIRMPVPAGKRVGITEVECWGPAKQDLSAAPPSPGNWAWRKEGADYPQASASFTSRWDRPEEAIDGLFSYLPEPRNRWTSYESPNEQDWFEVNFGENRRVALADLYFFDDRGGVQLPKSIDVEYWNGSSWESVSEISRMPVKPQAGLRHRIEFKPIETQKIRVLFTHSEKARTGLTEMELRSSP